MTRYSQALQDVLARVKQHKIDLVQTERPDDGWNDAYAIFNALTRRVDSVCATLQRGSCGNGTGLDEKTLAALHDAVGIGAALDSVLVLQQYLPGSIQRIRQGIAGHRFSAKVQGSSAAVELRNSLDDLQDEITGELRVFSAYSLSVSGLINRLLEQVGHFMEEDGWEERVDSASREANTPLPPLGDYTLGQIQSHCKQASLQCPATSGATQIGFAIAGDVSGASGTAPPPPSLTSRMIWPAGDGSDEDSDLDMDSVDGP